MRDKQRKIISNGNIGRDSHVRSYQGNIFKPQSSQTFQMVAGEISMTEPEPLFRQNMVTVALGRGGEVTSAGYPGAFIDPATGNFHGTYEGPIAGQMVIVGFENGNKSAPFVINRYPYQGKGDTLNELKYTNPLTNASFDSTDVIMGHFSGSYLSFNTGILSGKLPGSVTFKVATDFEMTDALNITFQSSVKTDFSSDIITFAATTQLELNGNTNFAILYNEMKTEFDKIVTDFNNHIHTTTATVGTGPVGTISPPTSPSTADMTSAKNSKVLM
jgi:hypothetical protein